MKKESLKILRIKAGLSQGRLAELSGSTQASITRYESDVNNLRKASYNTLVALADAVDVRVWDIDLGDKCGHEDRKIIYDNEKMEPSHELCLDCGEEL